MYEIIVEVPNFDPIKKEWIRQQLTGDFDSVEEAIEFWACELGTDEKEIEIIRCEKL